MEVGYSGSAGNHLIRPVDINAPTPAEIIAASKGVAGCDTALNSANNPANCINLARPFRGFGTITDRQTSATSRYHGLLTSFRLRPTRGITAQLAYTFSKNLTDATNDRDAIDVPQIRTNLQLERAVSRLDRTHVFVASYVYEIPTFHNGFASSGIGKALLGGWEIAGITTAQTGLPLNRVVQAAVTVPARGTRPDIVSEPLENIPVNPTGGIPYAFNPFAFRTTLSGQIGNSPRSPFRFPSQFFTDLNLRRTLISQSATNFSSVQSSTTFSTRRSSTTSSRPSRIGCRPTRLLTASRTLMLSASLDSSSRHEIRDRFSLD